MAFEFKDFKVMSGVDAQTYIGSLKAYINTFDAGELAKCKAHLNEIIAFYGVRSAEATAGKRTTKEAAGVDEVYAFIAKGPTTAPIIRKAFEPKSVEGALKLLKDGDSQRGIPHRVKVTEGNGQGAGRVASTWTAIVDKAPAVEPANGSSPPKAEKAGQGGKKGG